MVVPIVSGQLHGAQPEAVHFAKDAKIAVEIEAALDVEHGGDLALSVDPLDVGCIQGDGDRAGVVRDLLARAIEHAQRLLGFEALRVIVLGDEDGEEHGAEAAFDGAWQIELAIGLADADVPAVVELTVDGMDVAVEDERAAVESERGIGDLGQKRERES